MSAAPDAIAGPEDLSGVHPRSIRRAIGMAAGGALLALILIGQALYIVHLHSAAQASPPIPANAPPAQRLGARLASALGGSDRGVRRFRLSLTRDPRSHTWNVRITWAINRDISAGTVGNGAENDVYDMLQAVYTSALPIESTHLIGTYPLETRAGRQRESVVMRLAMSRSRAALINGVSWATLSAQDVWGLVDRQYVNPAVRPLVSE